MRSVQLAETWIARVIFLGPKKGPLGKGPFSQKISEVRRVSLEALRCKGGH